MLIIYSNHKTNINYHLPAPAPDLRLLKRVLLEESDDLGFLAPSSYNLATCRSIDVT